MQLPSIERSPDPRPNGADQAAPVAVRVIPVAPVNPPVPSAPPSSPGVVNDIDPQVQARVSQETQAVQAVRKDPLNGGARGDDSLKNWTASKAAPQYRPEEERAAVSEMLIEHMHSLWNASKRVIEIWMMNNPSQTQNPTQIQQQTQTRNQEPASIPGVLAKEALTYTPQRIKRPEDI